MKIGVVTTSYPRWPGDAAGNFVGAHVRAMRALGHEVDVIHTADDPLFAHGGAPDHLEANPRAFFDAAVVSAKLAARVAAAPRWDLTIAHWLVPSAIAALSHRPLLAIAHGGDIFTLARTHLLAPTIAILRRRARLAFVASHLQQLAGAPGLVQPMGIDVDHFSRLPRRPTNKLLIAARLVPIKGIATAIAAMDLLPEFHLMIAGDGPLRGADTDQISFLGSVDTTRRDQLLSEAAAVIVPSTILPNGRTEGTPMIALEALAAGVPVIGSRVGGLIDLPIAHVPPDDPHALAIAIRTTLDRPASRIDMAGYAWPAVANRLIAYALSRRTA
ncbi:MAG TPA: glycosyltransferase family 4 protein [Kofleriaceae bacterium]